VKQNVSWPVVVLVLAVVAGALAFAYRAYSRSLIIEHPGQSDIPPRKPGDDKLVTPPPGVRVPGTVPR